MAINTIKNVKACTTLFLTPSHEINETTRTKYFFRDDKNRSIMKKLVKKENDSMKKSVKKYKVYSTV